MENFRNNNQRFSTTFLRRSLSHKRLTSPLIDKAKYRRAFSKRNLMGLPVFEVKEEQEVFHFK